MNHLQKKKKAINPRIWNITPKTRMPRKIMRKMVDLIGRRRTDQRHKFYMWCVRDMKCILLQNKTEYSKTEQTFEKKKSRRVWKPQCWCIKIFKLKFKRNRIWSSRHKKGSADKIMLVHRQVTTSQCRLWEDIYRRS